MPAAVGATTISRVGGLLLIVPSGQRPAETAGRMIGGLPLLRRIVLAGTAAGFDDVLVRGDAPSVGSLLEGTRATLVGEASATAPNSRRRVVVMPANVVPQARWLRTLLEQPLGGETLSVDESLVAVIETDEPAAIVVAAARAKDVAALVSELRSKFTVTLRPEDRDGRFVLLAPGDETRAERWLLRSLIKQREGFMSRHVERRISLAVTRRLAATAITPNAMTIVSATVGLIGALFFLSSTPPWPLIGALLFLAHSILDGCDGELARLKFAQSRWGATLDFWGDNVVHVAVFACLAIGWSRDIGAAWPLLLGVSAAVGTVGAASVFFRRTMEDRVEASGAAVARLIDALGNRDFIYLVVLLAAFGHARWFLVAGAIGTPAFLLLALWLTGRHGRVR